MSEPPNNAPDSAQRMGGRLEVWRILNIDTSDLKPIIEDVIQKYWDRLPEEEKTRGRLTADMMKLVAEVIEPFIASKKRE